MNHFISITSNGGYIGRIAWTNTGTEAASSHWGEYIFLRTTNVLDSCWWGDSWVIRAITR
jgi:hypothetical protein